MKARSKTVVSGTAIEIFNEKCTGEGGIIRTLNEEEMAKTYPFG